MIDTAATNKSDFVWKGERKLNERGEVIMHHGVSAGTNGFKRGKTTVAEGKDEGVFKEME